MRLKEDMRSEPDFQAGRKVATAKRRITTIMESQSYGTLSASDHNFVYNVLRKRRACVQEAEEQGICVSRARGEIEVVQPQPARGRRRLFESLHRTLAGSQRPA